MNKISDKLLSWASIIEPNTQEQAERTSKMPFITPFLALMPDAHLGMGSTVGSVIPTKGAIMPAAVGVDIGCGMIAVKTHFTKKDLEGKDLAELRHSIERSIPLSPGRYNDKITPTAQVRIDTLEKLAGTNLAFYDRTSRNWRQQLGSLGGGNHFVEVTLDETDTVWLFLHSGSRGIGNKIAQHFIRVAQSTMNRYFIYLPDPDLAYLIEGTKDFDDYIEALRWGQHFALMNREEMMDRLIKDFEFFVGEKVVEQQRINCHHNFTQKEHHMGQDLWITRKGSISANEGQWGLIPGSMGTASYVVTGRGNRPSFCSAPHGAGRVFARNVARKKFTLDDMDKRMVGIEYRRSEAFLDEIPDAYKDIDIVIEDAKDLVQIEHTLHQIVNVKGE